MFDREGVKAFNTWLTQKHWKDFWLQQVLPEYGTGGPEMEGMEAIGHLPVHNWRGRPFAEGIKNVHGGALKERMGLSKRAASVARSAARSGCTPSAPYFVDEAYGGPEYEAMCGLGTNCEVDDPEAMVKANELCNAYSLDAISCGTTIAFAMECFEKGLLTLEDTGGLDLRFGNGPALVKCVELIGRREGIGDSAGRGLGTRGGQKIGRGAEALSVEVKGVHPGMHEPRRQPAFALGFMVNPNGADHCANVHDDLFASEHGMKDFASLGFYDTVPFEDIGPRKVAPLQGGAHPGVPQRLPAHCATWRMWA